MKKPSNARLIACLHSQVAALLVRWDDFIPGSEYIDDSDIFYCGFSECFNRMLQNLHPPLRRINEITVEQKFRLFFAQRNIKDIKNLRITHR